MSSAASFREMARGGNDASFAAWAPVYDTQANPLLALEERFLSHLLPALAGRTVLDLGCGTGRWLTRLAAARPSALYGIDSSAEMLAIAAEKMKQGARLFCSALSTLPNETRSVDVLIASFVLSYVADVRQCAAEISRVARDGADLFLSDMHPDTAERLQWKRGFASGNGTHHLHTMQHSLRTLLDIFCAEGFELISVLEPEFGPEERSTFAAQDKLKAFEDAATHPAIYIAHLRKRKATHQPETRDGSQDMTLLHATCALSASERTAASVEIRDGKISSLQGHSVATRSGGLTIDLLGYLLLPGFVNAHDHLEFGLYPRMGGGRYSDASEWAFDIQERERKTIGRYAQVSKSTRLWWGGIRNLLCGVTTVCHHNPLEATLTHSDFPVRVVSRFGWAHSLAFEKNIRASFEVTTPDQPFILHACEGTGYESAQELATLEELGMLASHTVLVHGLALDEEGIALLNARGTALIVCPSSNSFLFEKVHGRTTVRSVHRLALGSESPLTACGDLLDEAAFARTAYGFDAATIYSLLTEAPAKILRLRSGEGHMIPGSVADLVAVKDTFASPADTLANLTWRDVELVLVAGRVHLASEEIYSRLSPEEQNGLQALRVDDTVRWLRAPIADLVEDAEAVLGRGTLRLNGRALGFTDHSVTTTRNEFVSTPIDWSDTRGTTHVS